MAGSTSNNDYERLSYGIKPLASIKVSINGKEYYGDATGDGQYDAFVKALRRIYRDNLDQHLPDLLNYAVTIPPGGRTDALVQTVITWRLIDGKIIRTRALHIEVVADVVELALRHGIERRRERRLRRDAAAVQLLLAGRLVLLHEVVQLLRNGLMAGNPLDGLSEYKG